MIWATLGSHFKQKPSHNTLKLKPLLFLGLFVFTFLTSTFVSTQSASAAIVTSADKNSDPNWQVTSFLYYRSIAFCLANSSMANGDGITTGGRIDAANVSSGQWFSRGSNSFVEKSSPAGPYLKKISNVGADGKVNCGEELKGLVTTALNFWGISAPTLLCSIGMKRVDMGASQSPSDCISGSTQLERPGGAGIEGWPAGADAFRDYIGKVIYGTGKGVEPGLLDHEWYVYYKTVVANSCIPTITDKPSSTPKGSDNAYGYNNVKWVDISASKKADMIKTGSYVGALKTTDVVTTRPGAGPLYGEVNLSCSEIVSRMNDRASGYADWAFTNKDQATAAEETINSTVKPGLGGENSSCVIEGIGWIICPAFNFLAGVADATYSIIQGLLVTDVQIVSTDSGTYRAWTVMRTFANVGFVIVFLIIIFSQLTSVGVSNYGVKKLLPRIVVAAILVNVSFIVTQLAVDVSNILGGSLKDLLEGISVSDPTLGNNIAATGNTFTDITAGIFGGQLALVGLAGAGAAAYFGGAGLIIPIILAAVLAILITLFILVARQALIILLVVLSPLAFLAMLLPNTENYFKQWRKAFVALLLVYPLIALVFGASHLASAILLNSFSGTDNTLGKIVALAVMVLPLFVVPSLLKGSLNAIPAIGGIASKLAGRANGLIGKQAKQGYQRSTFGRSATIRRQAKENYRASKFAEGVSKGGVASFLAKEPGLLPSQRAANKAVDRTAIQAAEKADTEEVAAAETLMRSKTSNPSLLIKAAKDEMVEAVGKGDSVRARAAQNILLNSGGKGLEALHEGVQDSFSEPGSKDSSVGQSMRAALNRAGLKSKNNALASWAYNTDTIGETTKKADTFSNLSDVEIGGHSKKNLEAAVASGAIDKDRAARILSNPVVAGTMGQPEREYLEGIRGPVTTTPGGPTGGSGPGGLVIPGDSGFSGSGGGTTTTPGGPSGGSGPSGIVIPGDNNFNVPRS